MKTILASAVLALLACSPALAQEQASSCDSGEAPAYRECLLATKDLRPGRIARSTVAILCCRAKAKGVAEEAILRCLSYGPSVDHGVGCMRDLTR